MNIPTRQLPLGAGRRIPYDALVEYVESNGTGTGTAVVDTGYYPCDATTVYVDTLATADAMADFECAYVSEVDAFRLGAAANYGMFWDCGSGAGRWRITIASPTSNWWRGLRLRVSAGNRYLSEATTGYSVSASVVSFARKTRPLRMVARTGTRFYSGRIAESSVLIHDFTPCRVGTAGALYDRVSGTLFYSATSSPLIPGPDLP